MRVLPLALGVLLLGAPAAWAAPVGPALVGSVTNSPVTSPGLSEPASVAVSGNYAYTTAYEGGVLTAVDISNPAAPFVAGASAIVPSLYGGATVNIAGGYAYVASSNRNASLSSNDNGDGNGLTILDIHTNPAVPAIVGTLHDAMNLFGAYGVAVSGPYAYVAAQGLLNGQPASPSTSTGSFSVIDVSNPAAPTPVAGGHIDNASLSGPFTNALKHITSVFVSGNYAYVTAFYSNRLTIIDISNPANPRIVSSLADGTNLKFPADVVVSGNYAYVADQTALNDQTGLAVVDVSNPLAPHLASAVLGQQALLAGAYRVRVHGNFAYVAAAGTDSVSAIDISNPASPRLAGFVTDHTALSTPLGLDFAAGGYVIADSAFAPGQTSPTYPPYYPSLTTGTIAAIQLDPVPIAVTIDPTTAPPTATLQASASFTFSTSDQIATVQCQLDGAPLGFCTTPTSQQYGSLSAGCHTFTVQTADALGTTAADSYTWAVGPSPINCSPPVISGSATVGKQLSAANGTWGGVPAPSFGYQWQRCDAGGASCAAISGAAAQTYTVGVADVGSTLKVAVTASNAAGSATATSSPTGIIAASPPLNTKPPTVLGVAAVGQALACVRGSWTGSAPISYTYKWKRDGKTIAGATGSTYVIASADAKHALACSVRAANALGSFTAVSASLSAPWGAGSVGRPKLLARGAISVTVTCASVPGTVCHLAVAIAVKESLDGKKLLSVTAAKKTSKIVVLASRSLTLGAGKHKTITLTLGRTGQKLLTQLHKFAATLALTEAGSNGQTSIVSVQRLTIRKR